MAGSGLLAAFVRPPDGLRQLHFSGCGRGYRDTEGLTRRLCLRKKRVPNGLS